MTDDVLTLNLLSKNLLLESDTDTNSAGYTHTAQFTQLRCDTCTTTYTDMQLSTT